MDPDAPIPYIARTRDYYAALGFPAPYRWAEHAAVPFQSLVKPLAASRLALVTTAARQHPGQGDQGPGAAYNGRAKFFRVYAASTTQEPVLGINHVAIDFKHTTAEDQGSYFPLAALRRAAASGRIGGITANFYGVPTDRSQRVTQAEYAPDVLAFCRADRADAAVLVPNCPVCHQSLSLVARHLEANGIPTVIMGAAKDIVELAGVPRFVFSDFPLGNAAGRPNDPDSQDFTLGLALDLLQQATAPRATVQSPLRWNGDPGWKRDYGNVEDLSAAEIAGLRADFEAQKAAGKAIQSAVGSA
jgi:D-proline reductase (dithiol) PrdB